jgi:hypothetical protein
MDAETVIPYRTSWILPRNSEAVKVTYLARINPVEKVMGKTSKNAAM